MAPRSFAINGVTPPRFLCRTHKFGAIVGCREVEPRERERKQCWANCAVLGCIQVCTVDNVDKSHSRSAHHPAERLIPSAANILIEPIATGRSQKQMIFFRLTTEIKLIYLCISAFPETTTLSIIKCGAVCRRPGCGYRLGLANAPRGRIRTEHCRNQGADDIRMFPPPSLRISPGE